MVERFIALTEFSRGVFVHGGLPTEKIVVRPNFVAEDPVLRPDERSGAIFVGRLSQEKGIECLLEAWRSLPETPLTVVGDGPLRGWATDFVRANNMKQVTLVGTKPFADVLELLARTSFLVFPSLWYETFGRTIIEAFATGTPVLVSGIGAGASLVKNGVTGLHFEAGNPTDLAEKARQMVADPERPRLWGEAARGEYVRKYTGEAAYESLMRIYGDVMAGGR